MTNDLYRPPGESPAQTSWGWSEAVALVETSYDALAILRLFTHMRSLITNPPAWWARVPDLTDDEWSALAASTPDQPGVFELFIPSFRPIALNPAQRADALLALDVHMAYLRAQFGVSVES